MSKINVNKLSESNSDNSQITNVGGETLYSQSWLNIVFKGRNTEYGAYQLRKNYAKNSIIGFIIAFSIFAFSTSVPLLFNEKNKENKVKLVTMTKQLPKPKDVKPNKPQPPLPPKLPPPDIKTVKFLPPKVVPQEEEEKQPTEQEKKVSQIGDEDKDGVKDPGNKPGDEPTPVPDPVPEPPKEEKVELIVDEQAAYSSDHKAFFQRNFNKPRLAQANGIGGKFQVRITVDKEGRMVDKKVVDMKKVDIIDPATGEVYGFVKEINRVLDLMAKEGSFVPAKKGGKPVKAVLKFDLNFQVE